MILNVISSVLSIFIYLVLFDNTLKKRNKKINTIIFYGVFILTEILGSISTYFVSSISYNSFKIINNLVSISCAFILTVLYETTNKKRILIAIIALLIGYVSDDLFTIIILKINPQFIDNITSEKIFLGNIGVKILELIFILIFLAYWNRKIKKYDIQYNILIFSTPLCSLLITFYLALESMSQTYRNNEILHIIIILVLLNIINTTLLQRSLIINNYKEKIQNLEHEIDYQKDRYTQLCSSYRNTRRVIHDTRKHYITIQEYIANKEYEKLTDYTNSTIGELEKSYSLYNTGSLVVDSFLTHYKIQYEQANINFTSTLDFNTDSIIINDYEFCVILGNLLDNGYNYLNNLDTDEKFFEIKIYNDTNNNFVISSKNNYSENPTKYNKDENERLLHGYGLENIQMIVEKYKGMMDRKQENNEYEVIIVIPATTPRKNW